MARKCTHIAAPHALRHHGKMECDAPFIRQMTSPIGDIWLAGDADGLWAVQIAPLRENWAPSDTTSAPIIAAAQQLTEYFDGKRQSFDLPLRPAKSARGTVLRDAIAAIPYGETLTYGALARMCASSARAIGGACAHNPFPILIPCHRVLAAGAGENYSAGRGVETKSWLLAHEARICGKILI